MTITTKTPRTLSVHPDTRVQARVAAAHQNVSLRDMVGSAVERLARSGVRIDGPAASTADRVTIVATATPSAWEDLDRLRTQHSLTWDQVVRGALAADTDTAGATGGDR